jgi:hypothetical protein
MRMWDDEEVMLHSLLVGGGLGFGFSLIAYSSWRACVPCIVRHERRFAA